MLNIYSLFNIWVNDFDLSTLLKIITESIESDKKTIIGNHNLHSLYLNQSNKLLQKFNSKCDYIHIDGMSMVFIANLLGIPVHRPNRITYVDLIDPLIQLIHKRDYKVFYLGSKPGVAKKAFHKINQEIGQVRSDYHHGYFDISPNSKENISVLEQIKLFSPDILLVGMGMPRQESWIIENFNKIQAKVIMNSGACFDYVSGEVRTPPRWMGRLGLEWVFRLKEDPNRLWSRYIIEPIQLFPLFVKEFYKKRIKSFFLKADNY
ncbi:MAG: WecB/TagA/CpsF family glycosyltransferase [Fibrobacteria bacterium]|nr:WecB/TagA/CpsF family glycosyltransferase [Fibrobacteria bacterium]